MRLRALAAAILLAVAPMAATAQGDLALGQVRSAILTIDVDRVVAETEFGRKMADDLRIRTEALAAENATLAQQLQGEERSLTERRASMAVEDFRSEAAAFDARVQRVRSEQDAKQQALQDEAGKGRERLLNAATPVLARLMVDSGAVVILERRDVFLSAGLVDITDEAIVAIDAAIGDGSSLTAPPEAPSDAAASPPTMPETEPAPAVPVPDAAGDGQGG